jgi:spore maturation protein SpmB
MRLASFAMGSGGQTGLCTIVELAGEAGWLDANIRRWIKQLDLPVPGPEAWEAFIQQQTPLSSVGGLAGMMVDLTTLGTPTADQASMLAAMFSGSGATVFVKLTGPVALLRMERERFAMVCRSLRRED